ncbi:MAG: protein-glutamate O-methyltransferase CheR [Armatimonadetes bacterium]|nr:protein-glutamate O-methyltransferase CheR [Armatimonadota bacterium]
MLEQEDISSVLAKVLDKAGVDFSQYRDSTLRRRLSRRMAANNCADLESYSSLLDSDPSEYRALLSDFSIKYTEFFRDPWVFDIIRDRVLPAIVEERAEREFGLTIWSAGCATGEEAYSIASLAKRTDRCDCSAIHVLGTDIDPGAIATARLGSYVKALLPTLPDRGMDDDFIDSGNLITVSPLLREMVSFHQHDITSATAVESLRSIRTEPFDLVLCRNVLIYLHRPAQTQVVSACLDSLNPGGFLVLGTGETMPKSLEDRVTTFDLKARIYRRVISPREWS